MLVFLRLLVALTAFVALLPLAAAIRLVKHDASFVPDQILRVTENIGSFACRYRVAALVNGTSPGPQIRLKEGKTTWIRVYNDMSSKNLTMHWHGLSQSVAPFSDGSPRVAQWPIAPKHFFDYELHPEIGEAGTYFYHSHVGFQTVSATGPLIVDEASGAPPYAYDSELVMMFTDLFNRSDTSIEKGLLANPFVWSKEVEAVMVNGQSIPAVPPQAATEFNPEPPPRSGTPPCGYAVFNVQPSKTYRLRLIGGQALSLLSFAFENHTSLTVIEADGSYTQPYSVDRLQLGSGQRLDVLLKTKSAAEVASKKDYWIQIETRERPVNLTSWALLSYSPPGYSKPAVPTKKPITLPQYVGGWLEYALRPLKSNNFPLASEVTRRIILNNQEEYTQPPDGGASFYSVSNHSWRDTMAGKPYLVDIYQRGDAAVPRVEDTVKYGGWDPNTNSWPAGTGEVLEIILINHANLTRGSNTDYHPWHAHGGHFYDIGSGPGMYNATTNEAKLKGYTPVMRDTTLLYSQQQYQGLENTVTDPAAVSAWRGWRIRVQDAGVWMIHCHTTQHVIMGMTTVWIMGNASQITKNYINPKSGYFYYGGNVYGNDTFAPTVQHFFD